VDVQYGVRESHKTDASDRSVLVQPTGYVNFSPKGKSVPRFRWVFVPDFMSGEIQEVTPDLEVWEKGVWNRQTNQEERDLIRHVHSQVRSPHAGGMYFAAYDAAMDYANIAKFNPPHFSSAAETAGACPRDG
jgi:hypothetical protein